MKTSLVYLLSSALIFSWWLLAFSDSLFPSDSLVPPKQAKPAIASWEEHPLFDRDKLRQALNGDFNLMCALIAAWDIEAQMLQAKDIPAKRLSADDLKKVFSLWQFHGESPAGSFYPQTYLAAAILMALTPETSLAALPKGFRSQTFLFSKKRTDLIPFDTDPYHLEAVSGKDHMLAFISPYSHPSTVLALKQRSIPTINLGAPQTPEDLKSAIHLVGTSIGAKKKCVILSHFIDAALMAMNNHLKALGGKSSPNILYLNYRTFFSAPNTSTLAGYMIKQLGFNQSLSTEDGGVFDIPLEMEDIVKIDPDILIFSTTSHELILNQFHNKSPLIKLKAFKNKRIYFVDKNLQETPSQHFLLGYYDLYKILAEANHG